ncbi:MAG: hypothetical protein ACREIT_01050 [Tepidisphaeraceae bacterium]
MDRFEQKVTRVLKRHFKGAQVQLDVLPEDGRYTGFVIWPGFSRKKDVMARQNSLWKVLDSELTKPERARIITFFATTPAEMAMSYD